MAKKQYYSIDKLLKVMAEYYMLLGERSNGKSYQVKLTALRDALKGERFVYIRRWDSDIKARTVENYFTDKHLGEEPGLEEFYGLKARSGEIFLADDEGNRTDELVGYYCALNIAERYKSNVFTNVKNIIVEEFITDGAYLYDEPVKLMQLVSTIARDENVRVFLIGNTLSRVCPYFAHWCLEGVLKQKLGTIEVYNYHEDERTVRIAVEYCANAGTTSNMFFGRAARQIVSGEWDTYDLPRIPRSQLEYDMIYEVMITYQSFRFCMQLLIEPKKGGTIVFVYPLTKKRKIYRQIQEEFSDLPNVTNQLDAHIKPEALMIECYRKGKICYSDNLTGSDFKHVIENLQIF